MYSPAARSTPRICWSNWNSARPHGFNLGRVNCGQTKSGETNCGLFKSGLFKSRLINNGLIPENLSPPPVSCHSGGGFRSPPLPKVRSVSDWSLVAC